MSLHLLIPGHGDMDLQFTSPDMLTASEIRLLPERPQLIGVQLQYWAQVWDVNLLTMHTAGEPVFRTADQSLLKQAIHDAMILLADTPEFQQQRRELQIAACRREIAQLQGEILSRQGDLVIARRHLNELVEQKVAAYKHAAPT